MLRRERRDDVPAPQSGRPLERAPRPAETTRPVVCRGESVRAVLVVRREPHERAHPLSLTRRRLERPRQRGERSAPCRALNVRVVEQRPDVLPERARLARDAFVARRLTDENEPPRRPRAGRVEEVAVAGDGVGTLEPAPELRAELVAEQRRRSTAARERPFFQSEHEHDLERARSRSLVVEDRDAALRWALRRHASSLERREHILSRYVGVRGGERRKLAERPLGGAIGSGVEPGVLARRRRLQPPRVSHHEREQSLRSRDRILGRTKLDECGHGSTAKLLALLVDPGRVGDGSTAEAPLDEIDRTTFEPGKRRPQEREQIASSAAEPLVAENRDQGRTQDGLPESPRMLHAAGNPELRERPVERGSPAVDGLAHDRDALRRGAAAQQRRDLTRDELGRSTRAGALEEANRAVERGSGCRVVREQLSLEMDERGGGRRARGRWQLLDARAGECRQILDRPRRARRMPLAPARRESKR